MQQGWIHAKVDAGEGIPGRMKQTPILIADGIFISSVIAEKFKRESLKIDPLIAKLVYTKLLEYPCDEDTPILKLMTKFIIKFHVRFKKEHFVIIGLSKGH